MDFSFSSPLSVSALGASVVESLELEDKERVDSDGALPRIIAAAGVAQFTAIGDDRSLCIEI